MHSGTMTVCLVDLALCGVLAGVLIASSWRRGQRAAVTTACGCAACLLTIAPACGEVQGPVSDAAPVGALDAAMVWLGHVKELNSDLCLVVVGGSPNTLATQFMCSDFNDQIWMFSPLPDDHWQIINTNKSLCLTLQPNPTAEPSAVLATCDMHHGLQQWSVVPFGDGLKDFQIVNVEMPLCLAVRGTDTTTTAVVTTCGMSPGSPKGIPPDQRWFLLGDLTKPDTYWIPVQ